MRAHWSDEPIQPQHTAAMVEVADILADVFVGYGFALLVFDLGATRGHLNYISNADRSDMCEALREFIRHTEAKGLAS